MKINIRILYLYLLSFVGILIVVIGSVGLVNLGIKTFIFKDADRYEVYPASVPINKEGTPEISLEEQQKRQDRDLARQKQRDFAQSLSMLLVGIPLYAYHWKTIQKENKA